MMESWSENREMQQKQKEQMSQRLRVTGGQRGCDCFLHVVRLWLKWTQRCQSVSPGQEHHHPRQKNQKLKRARVEHLSANNIHYINQYIYIKKKSLESLKMSRFRWFHFHRCTTQMQWWETGHGRWLVRPSTLNSYHPALKCSRALQAAQEKAKSRQLSCWQSEGDSFTQSWEL